MTISNGQKAKDDALHSAVIAGDPQSVLTAIENGANINARWNPDGHDHNYTALQLAVARENIDVVKALLTCNGVDVNAIDGNGSTALGSATVRQLTEVVTQLLSSPEIRTDIQDANKRTPLENANKSTTTESKIIGGMIKLRELIDTKKRETWTGKSKHLATNDHTPG